MQVNLIAAVSLNGVIGNLKTNALPWPMDKYPEDMKFFRQTTSGENSVVIGGSNTVRSIGRALPKRRNIAVSRTSDAFNFAESKIETASTLKEALSMCKEEDKVWIIGGGNIYREGVRMAHKLYLTIIPENITAEDPNELVYFPFLNPEDYRIIDNITLSTEKQLFCYIYERDSWLSGPLEEKLQINNQL